MKFNYFKSLQPINRTLAALPLFRALKPRRLSALIPLTVCSLAAGQALADQGLINVDVNEGYTFSGAAVLGNAGDVWNEVTGSKQSLVDSTGNATVVGLTISGATGFYADTGGSAPANNPATAGVLTDYLFVNGGMINYQITGLLPNTTYNLVVYSAGDQTDQTATFSGAITTPMGTVSRGAFVLGANYGQNANAVSDANGTLTFATSAAGFHAFNGLQISGDFPANITVTGYTALPIGAQKPVTVTIPPTANQTQAFTFSLTNSNPGTLSLAGAANNVLTLVFPQGGASSQTVMMQGLALGSTTLAGNTPAASLKVTTVPSSGLVGHWLAGQQDLTDTSGYSPAGTHDGVAAAGSFDSDPGFNTDVPAGFTGYSADLGFNGCMIQIQNTSQANDGANYDATFDDLISQQMTVAFWVKFDANTTPGQWQPLITKRGEEAAWQIRTAADQPVTSFSVRGTSAADDEFDSPTIITNNAWHHIVAARDGVTGRRKLYVDGQLSGYVPNDFGSYSLDRDAYLILGGKWSQQSGTGGSSGGQLYGELFDVRIYAEALNGSQVQNLYLNNTGLITASAETPVIDAGHQGAISISIPDGANASQAVTVTVTNNSGLVTVAGYSGNVFTVTFPAGSPNTIVLNLTAGATEGAAQFGFGSASLQSASASVFVSGPHLIGEWGTNAVLADVSGFSNYNTPAHTHDGVQSGAAINFSSDVPNTKPGTSLDFTAGNAQVLITNTSVADANYRPTFDTLMSRQFTVACWVKENTGSQWTAFASKRGDDDIGWQLRRNGGANSASSTIRGSASEIGDMGGNATVVNDGNWHHVAAVWDGYSGKRTLYVDGILDTSITNDFGPFTFASGYHLMLGAEENRGVGEGITVNNQFNGKIYDLRVYNYPLTGSQVLNLATLGFVQLSTSTTVFQAGVTNTVTVNIPNGANQSSPVTVNISSGNTSIATIDGAVSNVKTLTFAAGGATSQTIGVIGAGNGKTAINAASPGITSGSLVLIVFAQGNPQLVGHWLSGAQTLADTSGFMPAGTHDGVAVGSTPGSYAWDADVPAGYAGFSLDLTANGSGGQVAIMVTNSSQADNNYQATYDNVTSNKFTVAFWAKGYQEGTWNPFVSKNGESTAWQFRMNPNQNDNPSFTIRGSAGGDDNWAHENNVLNDGNWHHYVGTYDSQTGNRITYVDGKRQLVVPNDGGGFTPAPNDHLMLGGKDTSGFSSWYNGQLFDVRIYNYAISADQVSVLKNPPVVLGVASAYTNVPAGDTVALQVTIPTGANDSAPVTVTVTDNAPGVATLVGAVNNVLTLTFPAGTLPVQTIYVVTANPGNIDLTATMGSTSVGLASPSVVFPHALIGHWLSGSADLSDTSGFTPAGTHDGYVVGDSPGSIGFSTDVPAGFSGQSLDLTANGSGANIGVAITNSSTSDGAYRPTFDDTIGNAFTIAFWEKGKPGWYNPWVCKYGENQLGWQVRDGYDTYIFTIRGSANNINDADSGINDDTNWHQITAVWDGVSGQRKLYVDGTQLINLTDDYAPMHLATGQHLAIGGRDNGAGWDNAWFNGLIYDLRIYNYPLSASEVTALVAPSAAPILTITPGANNTVKLSWPATATGYVIQTNSSLSGTWGTPALTPTVQNGQNVVTDVSTNTTVFYRLLHSGN